MICEHKTPKEIQGAEKVISAFEGTSGVYHADLQIGGNFPSCHGKREPRPRGLAHLK
jgi:hypothetical protein